MKRLSVSTLVVMACTGWATAASAHVGNPGTFDFNITSGHDSLIRFSSGIAASLNTGGSSFLEASVDSDGDMHGLTGTLPTYEYDYPSPSTHKIFSHPAVVSGSLGVVDPGTGDLEFNLRMNVTFQYDTATPCTTSNFSVQINTANGRAPASAPARPDSMRRAVTSASTGRASRFPLSALLHAEASEARSTRRCLSAAHRARRCRSCWEA